jgi:hypothetical protein
MDTQEIEPTERRDEATPVPAAAPARIAHVEPEGQRLRWTAAASGIVLLFAVFWLWPAAWGPTQFVALLAIAATVGVASALAFQLGQLLVDEPLSEVARVIVGEPLSVRSKTRFLARLEHECSDKQLRSRNRVFSLAVIAFPEADEVSLEGARNVLRRRIRARDVLSDLGAGEIWVLALGAGIEAAEAMAKRFTDIIAREAPGAGAIRIGWSTFEDGAFNAKQMIAVARQRAGLIDAQVAAELEEAA